jgi:hypothetical protein
MAAAMAAVGHCDTKTAEEAAATMAAVTLMEASVMVTAEARMRAWWRWWQ